MFKLFFLIFLLISGCAGHSKKAYICGDRQCIDKKEMKEYFNKTFSIEIEKDKENKKNKYVDLVKFNTGTIDKSKTKKKFSKSENELKKEEIKIAKIRLKDERKRLKEEERVRKFKLKNQKRIVMKKDKNEVTAIKNKAAKISNVKKNKITKLEKSNNYDKDCFRSGACDIDQVSKLVIENSKKKSYPDLTSK